MRVVHCKREPFTVYIGRPSKWGNEYSYKNDTIAKYKVSTVEECVERYEEDFRADPEKISWLKELKEDDVLACWCKVKGHEPCHGDVIAKLYKEFVCL